MVHSGRESVASSLRTICYRRFSHGCCRNPIIPDFCQVDCISTFCRPRSCAINAGFFHDKPSCNRRRASHNGGFRGARHDDFTLVPLDCCRFTSTRCGRSGPCRPCFPTQAVAAPGRKPIMRFAFSVLFCFGCATGVQLFAQDEDPQSEQDKRPLWMRFCEASMKQYEIRESLLQSPCCGSKCRIVVD